MKIADAINQLKDLKQYCKIKHDPDNDIWDNDVEALDAGIFALTLMEGRGFETIGGEEDGGI